MKNDYDRQILSYLNDHEMLTTEAAMEFLPLSEVSVRRIFNRLAELNLVRRVRGGVRPPVREQNIRIPISCADNGLRRKNSGLRSARRNW